MHGETVHFTKYIQRTRSSDLEVTLRVALEKETEVRTLTHEGFGLSQKVHRLPSGFVQSGVLGPLRLSLW